MTDRELHAYLDGSFVGAFAQSPSGNIAFTYDDAYRAKRDATPLSLAMPLTTAHHSKRAALPWLEGLLPDSETALRAIGTRFHASHRNPFALLEHVGADAAGAVQLLPPDQPSSDAATRTTVRRVSDADVARMLDDVVAEYRDGAPESGVAGRFSLAGAQPKIALHRFADGTWGVPEDATPTTHILKPVVGTLRRIDVVEQMTLRAAQELGNEVARSDLMRIGEWDVLVSERYDRLVEQGTWRRVHQEDLCQALSVSPQRKYQHREGGPGVAPVAALLRSLPLPADRAAAGRAFFCAFVFNIIAGCTDAHAKNYSLILDGRSARLAPLYDLLSFAAYWDGSSRIESAMSVDGEYSLDRIPASALVRLGSRFGLGADESHEIVEHTRLRMADAFEAAREGVSTYGPEAAETADALIAGVRRLPLVSA